MTPARLHLTRLFLLLGLACAPVFGAPESGRPVVRSFGSSEVHSSGPVVAFAETEDGTIFVGSNHLVMFDGFRWKQIEIPGAYEFRALAAAADPNRVWVGAAGAIGYVQRAPTGIWSFQSLNPALRKAGLTAPLEVSAVRPAGNSAVFVGAQEVLRWNGTKFDLWRFDNDSKLRAAGDRQHMWVIQQGTGIWQVGESDQPKLVIPSAELPEGEAQWILPPPNAEGSPAFPLDGMLVGLDSGVFRQEKGRWQRLKGISDFLSQETGVFAADLGVDSFVVGTLNNGIALATNDGKVVLAFNHNNGLSDDSVCGLWGDRRQGIWIGLNDGCTRLDGLGDVSIFDRREGLDVGLPRKVFEKEGVRYVLTDRMLYRINSGPQGSRFEPIFAGNPRLADAAVIDGRIWVSGSDGLRSFGNPPLLVTGRETGMIASAPWLPGGLVYAQGPSLGWSSPSSDPAWQAGSLEFHPGGIPNAVITVPSGRVWVSADGIYELKPSPAGTPPALTPVAHFVAGKGLPAPSTRPVVSAIGNSVFAFTESNILRFDEASAEFRPEPTLEGWTILASAPVRPSSPATSDYFWVVQRALSPDPAPYDLLKLHDEDGRLTFQSMRTAGLDNIGEITCMNALESPNGPILWLGGKGGLLRVDVDRVRSASNPRHLELREILATGEKEENLEIHPNKMVRLEPGTERLEFAFSAAQPMETAPMAVYYQTRLDPVESDWSASTHRNTREFTGLAPGSYTFLVRRLDRHGVPTDELRYPFAVIAPWYATWPAVALYGLAAALLVIGILRWRLRALRERTEQLDRLVATRTRELELSNTAKSEFLETISHEIRNPLNGIVGLAALLKPEDLGPEDARVARSLQQSAEHLRRVAEDVLGFSRVEMGEVSVVTKPFGLRKLLEELMAGAAEQARRQGNTLTLNFPAGTGDRFVGDPQKIRSIVGNFLNNALNYAPGVPLELKADWPPEGGSERQVFIAVVDSGPGVPPEEQELIFQKFVRGTNTKANRVTGSGIGLALCRSLAQTMGGAVGVESPVAGTKPGPGASFYLWIPLVVSTSAAAAEPILPSGSAELGALIVDDEDYNRTVLEGLCRELGFLPYSAPDAAAAFAILESERIAVIFLDLELRGADGCEVAERIRLTPSGSQAIIVAVTGNDSEDARRRCEMAEMDGFLLKPVSGEEIRAVIAKAKRGPWRAIELYAKSGAGTREDAGERYLDSLAQEVTAIQIALKAGDRATIRAAAHRLRALGALVHDAAVNRAAAELQDKALGCPGAELNELVSDITNEVERLKVALTRSGVGALGRHAR